MGRLIAPGYRELRAFPCRECVYVHFDAAGFPVGLVVDSIGYRVSPSARSPIQEGDTYLELTKVVPGDEQKLSYVERWELKIADRRRLLRREMSRGNRRRIRMVAGLLFEDLRHWYWQCKSPGSDRAPYAELAAAASRKAAAELTAEFGLKLVPLRGRRALATI